MMYSLKALYQHIVAKIEIVTFSNVFCIFLGQENGNVRIRDPYITFILLRAKCHQVKVYYYARLICKASVYKLMSELFLATSCLLYTDTVPLILYVYKCIIYTIQVAVHVHMWYFNFICIMYCDSMAQD